MERLPLLAQVPPPPSPVLVVEAGRNTDSLRVSSEVSSGTVHMGLCQLPLSGALGTHLHIGSVSVHMLVAWRPDLSLFLAFKVGLVQAETSQAS